MCTGFEIGLLTLGAAGVGTTLLAQKEAKKSSSLQLPQLPPEPALPDPDVIKDQAKEDARKRAGLRTKTILTSGAGIIDEPKTKAKTLLGG